MKNKSLVLILGALALTVSVGMTANAAPTAKASPETQNELVIETSFVPSITMLAVKPYVETMEVSFIESIELNYRPAFFWKPLFVIQGTCFAEPAIDLPDVRYSTGDNPKLINFSETGSTALHIDPGLCS